MIRVVLIVILTLPLFAQTKVALVIGNYAYTQAPLKNPKNDVNDISVELKKIGFDVLLVENANLQVFNESLKSFEKKISNKDSVGLFYYAGHAVQISGKNYLIPVSNNDALSESEAFELNSLINVIDKAKNNSNIIILDACRNNPYNDLQEVTYNIMTRSIQRGIKKKKTDQGLADLKGPAGTFIAFATAPNQVAEDGLGRNGTYTKYLLKNIHKPGHTIEQVFKNIRKDVMTATNGKQIPWEHSSLINDFYFKNPAKEMIKVVENAISIENYGLAYNKINQALNVAVDIEDIELLKKYKREIRQKLGAE